MPAGDPAEFAPNKSVPGDNIAAMISSGPDAGRFDTHGWLSGARQQLVRGTWMPGSAPSDTIEDTNAIVDGKTIAQWTEGWWNWLYHSPSDQNPLTDTTGKFATENNTGPVFFLTGAFVADPSQPPVERYFDVPRNTPVLLPMVNFGATPTAPLIAPNGYPYQSPNGRGSSNAIRSAENRAIQQLYGSVTNAFATIDGTPVTNPFADRVNTSFFSMGTAQAGTVATDFFGEVAGASLDPVKSGGYWLMLKNLSPGDHTLTFGGSIAGVPNMAGTYDPSTGRAIDYPAYSLGVIDHIHVA